MPFMWFLAPALALAAPEMIPAGDVDMVGKPAPTFTAKLRGGGSFDLAAQKGERVVLAFWASWCGPCRLELPALSKMQAERDDVTIYAVNVDRNPRRAEGFLSQVQVDLPVVYDPTAAALGQYDVISMPTMFLIEPDGKVSFRKTGYSQQNGLSELEAALAGGGQ